GLACDPQERFASAQEMSQSLKRCKGSAPVEQRPHAAREWIASLRMPTDDALENAVVDHSNGSLDLIWTSQGSIEESGSHRAMSPLPPEPEEPPLPSGPRSSAD